MTQIAGEHQPVIIVTDASFLINLFRIDRNNLWACPGRPPPVLRPASQGAPLNIPPASWSRSSNCADFVSARGNSRQRCAKRLCPGSPGMRDAPSTGGIGKKPLSDLRSGKPASRMGGDLVQSSAQVVQFNDTTLEHLVKQP